MRTVTARKTNPKPCRSLSELCLKLIVIALTGVLGTTILALFVAHGRAPYGFEDPALAWLGPPAAHEYWGDLARLLAAPVVCAVLLASIAFGFFRRAVYRVAVYTVFAAAALLISEFIVKPLVGRTYDTEFSFPAGHVAAVSGTALAMWLALYPLLEKRARTILLVLGVLWTLLMSVAVVGAQWHTPLDAVGAILLSVGIVCASAAAFESPVTRTPNKAPRRLSGQEYDPADGTDRT